MRDWTDVMKSSAKNFEALVITSEAKFSNLYRIYFYNAHCGEKLTALTEETG
jgi:hypothetical protein